MATSPATVPELKTKEDTPQEMAQELASRTKEITKDVVNKVKTSLEGTPELIRRYPFQSLAIGFGVGFVSALLIRRTFD